VAQSIVLGKTEGQDSFIFYDGTKVLFDKVYQEDWKRLGLEPGLLQGVQLPHV